jgi:hypothetical protein
MLRRQKVYRRFGFKRTGARNATMGNHHHYEEISMADDRNVAHDKKVASDKAKAAGGGVGKDTAANVDGDGLYTPQKRGKHLPQPGKKPAKKRQ